MKFKRFLLMMIMILGSFSAIGCNLTATTTQVGLDYSEFDSISDYTEVFNRREGNYLVYVYQTNCSACIRLKTDFLAFADTYSDKNIYFFNVGNLSESADSSTYLATIGQPSVQTPVLLVIKNNSFDKNNVSRYLYTGESKIRAVMTDLQNGSFLYWD